jgi:Uncharacterized protein with conserved CXXC pairs
MKCQNCGKNEANFHYRADINGQVTEQHLCQECAAKAEGSVFASTQNGLSSFQNDMQSLFAPGSMFSPMFGMSNRNNSWDNMARGFLSNYWGIPQMLTGPYGSQTYQPLQQPGESASSDKEKSVPSDAGDKFKRRRELNSLRCEMRAAVKSEDFERAAELRDRIHRLESAKDE